jgi:hypothetical protein
MSHSSFGGPAPVVLSGKDRESDAPIGWKLVPRIPTQAMLDAVPNALPSRALDTFYDHQMAAVYRAMLQAAPLPPNK